MAASQIGRDDADLSRHDLCTLRLTDIVVESTWYARQHTQYNTVETLTVVYRDDPGLLPPLDVFQHAGRYVLADGFHRYEAARRAEVPALPCRIFPGTPRDAVLHAVQVNGRQHGLPYHQRDYERIIRWFVADDDLAALSHREMARQIGCSHTLVNRIAKAVQAETTVAAALALETVSTRAKKPQSKEEQQLAALLQVPTRVVHQYGPSYLKTRLIREVTKGATVEEAAATVRPSGSRPAGPSAGASVPAMPPRPEAPPPPSEAVVALSARIAEAFLQPVRVLEGLCPAPLAPEAVLTTLTATLMADPAAFAHTDWHEVLSALGMALGQIRSATDAYIEAIEDWRMVFQDDELTFADPSTLVGVLEQLTAQRYQHPPGTARAIGQAITSLEAYLAAHAPTSTTHPARHEVEL